MHYGARERRNIDALWSLTTVLLGEEQTAPGTPGYNPAWYALTDIYWDPAGTHGGKDSNAGTTSAAPVLTWAEIVRRFGSTLPVFVYAHSVTVHQLSPQPAGQDPVFFEPRVSGGGQAILNVTPTLFGTSNITVNTAKSRGAPGTLLTLTLASVPAGITANMLAVNTTRGSQAIVDSVGATVVMQQPQTTASLTSTATVPAPVEDDTWTTGDSVSFYTLANTNLKRWCPVGGDDTAAAQPSSGWVFYSSIADPSGSGASVYPHGCNSACNVLTNCVINSRTHVTADCGRGGAAYLPGCSGIGQLIYFSGQSLGLYGGGWAGGASFNGIVTLQNDVIMHGGVTFEGGAANAILDNVYSDGAWTNLANLVWTGILWGSFTTANFGRMINSSGSTWVLRYLTSGAMKLGTSATGSSYTGSGVWADGVAVNQTNIDAGGAGGKGLTLPQTGFVYCNLA